MHNATCGLVGLLLLSLMPASHAVSVKLNKADRHQLLTAKFRAINRTEDLPSYIKEAFARSAHQPTFEMADPGKPFEETDNVIGKPLPFRRLIFAGMTDDLCVMHYEHGGIGYHCDVVLFRITGTKVRYVWHGWASRKIPNIAELRKEIGTPYIDTGDLYHL